MIVGQEGVQEKVPIKIVPQASPAEGVAEDECLASLWWDVTLTKTFVQCLGLHPLVSKRVLWGLVFE